MTKSAKAGSGALYAASGNSDPRSALAFPTLSDADLTILKEFGVAMKFKKGEYVWKAGDPNLCMFVVLEGELEIQDGRSHMHVTDHPKGHFSGDIDVLSGRPSIVNGLAGTHLEVLEVAADCVREIVGRQPELGETILRAFLMRRTLLQEQDGFGPLVVGSHFSPDTLRIREFLFRNRLPYSWEDLESAPNVAAMLCEFQVEENQTPIVVLPSGATLKRPSNLDLAEALGVSRPAQSALYDLVVIGAGPAGLAAGVYGASEGLSTLIVDSAGPGGQAGSSARIENYVGFPTGLSGQELADRAVAQVERFGAEMKVPAKVVDITCNKAGGHFIEIEGQGRTEAKCVLLATGASYRKLGVAGMERFEGRGIYYACTNIERVLCRDDAVAVVGAGNSAGQAAVFLAEQARHVFLVVRGPDLRKSMSSYLALRVESSPKITVLVESEITKLSGDSMLKAVSIRTGGSGVREEAVSGVFVMIGAVPRTDWVPGAIARDPKGFVLTGSSAGKSDLWSLARPPLFLETSCPGVFAAGDARASSVKRVASAVGEGSMAVALAHQYLALA